MTKIPPENSKINKRERNNNKRKRNSRKLKLKLILEKIKFLRWIYEIEIKSTFLFFDGILEAVPHNKREKTNHILEPLVSERLKIVYLGLVNDKY